MIELRALGPLELQGSDGMPVDAVLVQPKAAALVVYLAVASRGGYVRRDPLLGMFWSEHDEEKARAALRQALYALRQDLDADAIVTRGTDEVGLNTALVSCDVSAYTAAADSGDLERAVELYRGPFLNGFYLKGNVAFDQWVDGERERLAQNHRDALEQLAEQAKGRGQEQQAVEWSRRLAAQSPYSTRVALRYMQALEAVGDRAQALAYADRFGARLKNEMDAEPSPDVQAYARRLRDAPVRHVALNDHSIKQEAEPALSTVTDLMTAMSDRYIIHRELGKGGMATVYLAEDVKHHRQVAIKVLRPELAATVGAERFLREIEVAAKLDHPHILPLHDSGKANGFLYYVMPYVEGGSVREKLNREKQLSIKESIEISMAVASALDYAHRHGVIHRDIKPENVLLQDGQPVVSDFGIALAISAAGGQRLTETGLSVGTPHYMSPEQATADQDLDARSDIYSLGCVTYEMLVGEPPYTGATPQAILAKIITGDPEPVTTQRKAVPTHVDAAIAKALEKVPADRFTGVREFGAALADRGFRYGEAQVAAAARSWKVATLALAATTVASVVVASWPVSRSEPRPIRDVNVTLHDSIPLVFVGEAPGGGQPALALSPNGEHLAYVGRADTTTRLYLRSMANGRVTALPGTEGAFAPFFSPDGEWIGFFSGQRLMRVSADGERVQPLLEVNWPYGGSWAEDGRIAVVTHDGGPLVVIPPGGDDAEIVELAGMRRPMVSHPHWLPGGERILLTCYEPKHICAGSTDGEFLHLTLDGPAVPSAEGARLLMGSNPTFLPPAYLVYAAPSRNALLGVRFDPGTLSSHGEPQVVFDGIRKEASKGAVQASISSDGDLVLARGSNVEVARFVWASRDGPVDTLPFPPRFYGTFDLSPDNRHLAAKVFPEVGPSELWFLDLGRGAPGTRWADQGVIGDREIWNPVWLPGSDRVLIIAGGDTNLLLEIDAHRANGAEILWSGVERAAPEAVAPDGRIVLQLSAPKEGIWNYTLLDRAALADLPAQPTQGLPPIFSGAGLAGVHLAFAEVSPDGTWLVYQSDEAGSYHVYAFRLGSADSPIRISSGPGTEPRWSPRGDGLYYKNGPRFYWVPFVASSASPFGDPQLFMEGKFLQVLGRGLSVSADGSRLLLLQPGGKASTTTLDVIQNFRARLEEVLGGPG